MRTWTTIAWILTTALLAPPVHADSAVLVAPTGARGAAVAVSEDGYAVVWYRLEDGQRFVGLDPDGVPLSPAVPVEGPSIASAGQALAPAPDGGWWLAGRSFSSSPGLWTAKLTADGALASEPSTIVADSGFLVLGPPALAANGNAALVVWSQDVIAGDAVFARALGDDGAPSAPRSVLMTAGLQRGAPLDVDVVPGPGGFLALWEETGQVVRVRETKREGQPLGEIEDAAPTGSGGAGLLETGTRTSVAYFAGRDSLQPGEVRLVPREHRGSYGDPKVLVPESDGPVGLAATATDGRRIAVAYWVREQPFLIEERFVEFDEDLVATGLPRDLFDELGVSGILELSWDPYRERWYGLATRGPEGAGIYLVFLDPAE